MADDLVDDEAQELLAELRVEIGLRRERAQPGDLRRLARRVGGRESRGRALYAPTFCVVLNRSASRNTRAASMLSMLSR